MLGASGRGRGRGRRQGKGRLGVLSSGPLFSLHPGGRQAGAALRQVVAVTRSHRTWEGGREGQCRPVWGLCPAFTEPLIPDPLRAPPLSPHPPWTPLFSDPTRSSARPDGTLRKSPRSVSRKFAPHPDGQALFVGVQMHAHVLSARVEAFAWGGAASPAGCHRCSTGRQTGR